MPKMIVIRLHPDEPVTGSDFSDYLSGLKIEAWDASVTKPRVSLASDPTIGEASGARIVQNWRTIPGAPPLFPLVATATALLEITSPPASEYADLDIVLRITRGGSVVQVVTVAYNSAAVDVPAVPAAQDPPAPSPFPTLGAPGITVGLPSPALAAHPGDAFVTMPTDGSPPNFDDLKTAVEQVLAQDPGGAVDLTALTAGQCRHIAGEIAWNRHVQPKPMGDLERLYTRDFPGFDDKAYQMFEAELMKYDAVHEARAQLLGTYIHSMVAALICERETAIASRVWLGFPIRPGVLSPDGKIKEAQVILTN